jgi:tight adherence protein B
MTGLEFFREPVFVAGAAAIAAASIGWFVSAALAAGASEYTSRYQSRETFSRPLSPSMGEKLLFMPAGTFIILKVVCAAIGMIIGACLGTYLQGFQKLLPILMLGFPGYMMPDMWRSKARAARLKKFNIQMIDGLRSISYSMRSGLPFPDAVLNIAQNMNEPISVEFGLVYNEWRLNLPIEDAMENLWKRMPVDDLRLFVVSFKTVHSKGGRLREICEKNMQLIQQRMQVEEKIDSMTAEGRLQSYMLSLAPLFLMGVLYFIDPTLVLPLFTTFTGIVLLFIALVLDVIGFFAIRFITTVKV